jgi:hypothetical protein
MTGNRHASVGAAIRFLAVLKNNQSCQWVKKELSSPGQRKEFSWFQESIKKSLLFIKIILFSFMKEAVSAIAIIDPKAPFSGSRSRGVRPA